MEANLMDIFSFLTEIEQCTMKQITINQRPLHPPNIWFSADIHHIIRSISECSREQYVDNIQDFVASAEL